MKAVEIRGMSPAELNATNQLNNPGRIADVKKDIARVKTIIREKQTASAGR